MSLLPTMIWLNISFSPPYQKQDVPISHASPAEAGVHLPAGTSGGNMGSGFPHGTSPRAESPRDSAPQYVSFPVRRRVGGRLEEDKGPDDDVLAASRVAGRGRVDTGGMERPARDGAVGHRVVAFEHRDLGGLLLGEPVPLVVGTVGEAGGLADTVVVDPVVGDVGLVGEGGPGAEHERKLL